MFEEQPVKSITTGELVAHARQMLDSGHRLVHICCTPSDPYEITYAFDKGQKLTNVRVTIAGPGSELPSITGVYLAAFGYENELHDLFAINVIGNAIDFKGNFYRTAKKAAFAPSKPAPQGPAQA
jgi:ech hydrogenase subunit D